MARKTVEASAARWRAVAAGQGGLVTRAQLRDCGVDRFTVRNQVAARRWVLCSATVVATTTGPLSRLQLQWLGVLHGGPGALLGDLSAAELGGLRGWHREDLTVLLPHGDTADHTLVGVIFKRTRRPLPAWRAAGPGPPRLSVEPAVLHWAAYQPSARSAQGVLAAVVQQRLTTPSRLLEWADRMRPLPRAPLLRRVLVEIEGGAQSLSELDIGRLCRRAGLAAPRRQTRRRDTAGRWRFTDCEWSLDGGRTLVLEVDGSFHMHVAHWEDDLARQRGLTSADRVVVRCTARELRDSPDRLARDLAQLGVPAA